MTDRKEPGSAPDENAKPITETAGADRVTFVDLDVGLGKHRFQITFNGFCEIEDAVGSTSPMELYRQVSTGSIAIRTLQAVLLAGLRGGGMEKPGQVVDAIIRDRPLVEAIQIAETVLGAALVGVERPA